MFIYQDTCDNLQSATRTVANKPRATATLSGSECLFVIYIALSRQSALGQFGSLGDLPLNLSEGSTAVDAEDQRAEFGERSPVVFLVARP